MCKVDSFVITNAPSLRYKLPPILHNSVPCGGDGLLGDAHDVVDGLIVHTHFVEDEEEGVENNLLIIRKSRAARCNNCL